MNEEFYTLVNYVEQVSDQSGGWLIQLLKRFGVKLGLGDKGWVGKYLMILNTEYTQMVIT